MGHVQGPSENPQVYDIFDVFISQFAGKQIPPTWTGIANVVGSGCSCGTSILTGLRNTSPKDIVYKVLTQRHPNDYKKVREAFAIFSDTDHKGVFGGNALCSYIRENKLGDIVELGPRQNPNTGNMIKIWIWAPPHESLDSSRKWMPIYGKILRQDGYGNLCIYEDDLRFKEREAK